jgi:signal transduction histidine kinase
MFVIAALPLLLAAVLGGIRIHAGVEQAHDLRVAADNVQMVQAVDEYMAATESVLAASAADDAVPQALSHYEVQRSAVEGRRRSADPDVRRAVTTLLDDGRALVDQAAAHESDLARQTTAYASLLPAAQTTITGSVRADTPQLRARAEGLSSALAARGRMAMQRMLLERGGDLPESELRSSMTTLAGGEASTVAGMATLLGESSDDAAALRAQADQRLSMLSDPAQPLPGNPDLLASVQVTDQIAQKLLTSASASLTTEADDQAERARTSVIRESVVILVALLIVGAIVGWVASFLVRPLRRLRDGALRIAHGDLVKGIELVKAGGEPDPPPLPINSTDEVGQAAHAVDELHVQALQLAGDETRLRAMVNDMFETMSRRNRSLVDQQLSLIDQLERNEEDSARLDSLFRLDHLAARMRRNGDNLLVLADAVSSREQADPMPATDVVNAAASEVEEYQRIEIEALADCTVVGPAATDSVHLVAELLDNALRYSPPSQPVRVRAAYTVNGGLLVEVNDAGLGMTDSDLRMANMRLTSAGEVSPDSARHMGLFVTGRLARRHGMTVRLLGGAEGVGTTAQLYVPPGLLEGAPVPVVGEDAPSAVGPLPEAPDQEPAWQAVHQEPNADAPLWLEPDLTSPPEPSESVAVEPDAVEPDSDVAPVTLLPLREPGSSGIREASDDSQSHTSHEDATVPTAVAPADTSRFFSWRRVRSTPAQDPSEEESPSPVQHVQQVETAEPADSAGPGSAHTGEIGAPAVKHPLPTSGSGVDLIYQSMVSEWLVDPWEITIPRDWKSVWDHGWAAAADAENTPVQDHTDHGLPVREPGARLVPGAAESGGEPGDQAGGGGAGADSRRVDDTGEPEAIDRDPDAIRSSISNHFGGVRAGRMRARDSTQGLDER